MDKSANTVKAPGLRWPLLLGATGFIAGFIGPMIFAPEANQGPLVGLLISGPAGVVLGLVLWVATRLLNVAPERQWQLLTLNCGAAVVIIALAIQPQPATRGIIYDVEIHQQRAPRDQADAVVEYWKGYIARVTWTAPRSGWEEQMRADLQTAPGTVLDVTIRRKREIQVHRKLWNKGKVFATAWEDADEAKSFYLTQSDASSLPEGNRVQLFLAHDSLARIEPAKEWPPAEVRRFINLSHLEPLPAEFAHD